MTGEITSLGRLMPVSGEVLPVSSAYQSHAAFMSL
jgi:hypothetical protein